MTAEPNQPSYPGASVKGPAERFAGDAWFDVIVRAEGPSRLRLMSVHFAPGARTAWHSHAVGQTLYVTEGVALTQERGGEVVTVHPGQAVTCGPGVEHWHGAHPDHLMTHLSIWEAPEPGSDVAESTWLEHVADDGAGR
ncbi:(R)-mandelonitrile lyase [Longivirga aurantiaca]